jgi:hypothetical protein
MHRLALGLAVLALLAPARPAGAAAPPAAHDFDRAIAPLLVRHCADCHSGRSPRGGLDLTRRKSFAAGGDSGPAVVPGKPDASLLWQRVRDGEMPPKKRLAAADKAALRAWIAAGARWGSDPIDPFRTSTARRAGYDWWSLQPVVAARLPTVRRAGWARDPVDLFVLQRLEANGLSPSPEADRRTLLRRVTFDLIGLPPTPEEVAAFEADTRPDAYERVVDRLLASPAHGERWARHWLDVVRFAESNGFERDQARPNAWGYRDWVAGALNRDLPYDEFVRQQLAGDVLRPGGPEALAATGFLVAGPHDVERPASATLRESMRQDELEDVVGTTAQALLGLTVHCARCHDHKFDPLAQKDYYRLAAALAGVGHGERDFVSGADRRELARLRARADALRAQLDALEAPARRQALAERRAGKGGAGPRPLAEWDFQAGLADRAGPLHGTRHGAARLGAAGLVVDGKSGFVATAPLRADLRAKTFEAWVRLDNLAQRGGGVVGVQTLDGKVFDALVFGEQEPGRWLAGSDFFRRTRSFNGPAEARADREPVHVALAYDADGTVRAYRNGEPYGTPYRSAGPVTFKAGQAQVVFGLRHAPAGGNRLLAGVILRARLYDRALTAEEVGRSAGTYVSEADLVARLTPAERARRQAWTAELERLGAEERRLEARRAGKVYAVVPFQPGPTHLLVRGHRPGRGRRPRGPHRPGPLRADLPPAARRPRGPAPRRPGALGHRPR